MRYQRLGIVGLGLFCALGAAAVMSSTCGTCDGQNITATGETRQTAINQEVEELAAAREALVIGGALEATSNQPLNLFGGSDSALETTTTTNGADSETTLDPESDDGSTTSVNAADATSTTGAADATSTTATAAATTKVTTNDTSQSTASPTTTTTAPPTTAPPTTPVNTNVPVNGSKIYVNPSGGDDGNNGASEATALKTVQSAFRRVEPGQTIYLMGGDYWENKTPGQVHFHLFNKNGRSDAWIRIAAAPGHRPVLNATNGSGLLIQGDYVEVSGLTIKGSGFSASNSWGVGISVGNSHHVRVIGNTISGMPVSGISGVGSSNLQVINNTVYENSYWSSLNGSGISIYNAANHGHGPDAGIYHDVIMGNRVFRNENKVNSQFQSNPIKTDGNGIIIDENKETGYTGRTLIANNLVYDNGGRGIIAYSSTRVDIMFNTAYHNGRTGNNLIGGPVEMTVGRASDVKFISNIAWARSGAPAFTMSFQNGSGIESTGNVWISDAPHGDENRGNNNRLMSSNPGLRNPSTGSGADFRPRSDSFLSGFAGSPHGMVPRDIVGTNRGSGSAEPGAFEAEAGSGR